MIVVIVNDHAKAVKCRNLTSMLKTRTASSESDYEMNVRSVYMEQSCPGKKGSPSQPSQLCRDFMSQESFPFGRRSLTALPSLSLGYNREIAYTWPS